MAECRTDLGHGLMLNTRSILAKNPRHMDWLMRAAVEIKLNPNNMKLGGGGGQILQE
jgi:hypothetical protein